MEDELEHYRSIMLALLPELTCRYGAGFSWEIRLKNNKIIGSGDTEALAWKNAYVNSQRGKDGD